MPIFQMKTAVRSLTRNKIFTAINILGLATGMATCLIIMLYIKHETSYDKFPSRANRIARVVFQARMQGGDIKEADVMPPVAKTMQLELPEVEEVTRLFPLGQPIFTYEDKRFKEDHVHAVDSNFFRVFDISFLRGDPHTALLKPYTMIITRNTAERYFGKSDPIGKVLATADGKINYTITGLIEGIPENAHFTGDIFTSMASEAYSRSDTWTTSGFYTYLVLKPGTDFKRVNAKLPALVQKYMGPTLQQAIGMDYSQFVHNGNSLSFQLQPLTSIHLHSGMLPMTELKPIGDIRYVYIFSIVGLFMLLIACINFMNLSTATASKRAREVGVRKVLGSLKSDLRWQFLLESLMMVTVALAVAIALLYLAMPLFSEIAKSSLQFSVKDLFWAIPSLLAFCVITGLLAGSYPAFYLSSFRPVAVLKGKFVSGKKNVSLRRGLVVFQFFVSTVLILGTIVVSRQLSYMQNKKVGYNKDQVLILPEAWLLGKNQHAFVEKMRQDPHVVSVSVSGYIPAGPTYFNNFMAYAGDPTKQIKTVRYEVDQNYLPTMGMEILEGRNFSTLFGTDSSAMILNETAAKALGLQGDAIGKTVSHQEGGKAMAYSVIGIVKDFNFKSFHDPVTPLVMTLGNGAGVIIIKTKPNDINGLLRNLQTQWKAFDAQAPITFNFLDQLFYTTFQSEQRTARILGIFAGLTIFVACLGLFGLAAFTAEQRTKEIGIRKVLGASVYAIVQMLSTEFLKLVIIANLIAWPLAAWLMHNWLNDFAYRITLHWWYFAVAAGAACVITLITISFQSIRAAVRNPVKSLRNE